MTFQVFCKSYSELSKEDLYEIFKARNQVFVVEQHCVYQDLDDLDQSATHLWLVSSEGLFSAYARIFPPNVQYKDWSFGRVLTSQSARNEGVGHLLLDAVLEYIKRSGGKDIRISALAYLKGFYQDYGFKPVGEEYMEDGISHIQMFVSLD